jgi:hypothetical protein
MAFQYDDEEAAFNAAIAASLADAESSASVRPLLLCPLC